MCGARRCRVIAPMRCGVYAAHAAAHRLSSESYPGGATRGDTACQAVEHRRRDESIGQSTTPARQADWGKGWWPGPLSHPASTDPATDPVRAPGRWSRCAANGGVETSALHLCHRAFGCGPVGADRYREAVTSDQSEGLQYHVLPRRPAACAEHLACSRWAATAV